MNISRHAYPVLGIFTLLTAASLGAPHLKAATPSQPSNVNVVNTTSSPIPTAAQGNTPVTQSGAWSVGLSPAASVAINNAAASAVNVRDAGEAARIPVNVQVDLNILEGQDDVSGQIYFVPYTKRLVIQTIYGRARLPQGQKVAFGQIIDYLNSKHIFYPVQFQGGGFDGFEYSSAITQVEINVLPGTQVYGEAFRTATTGLGDCQIGFSGYLVDAS